MVGQVSAGRSAEQRFDRNAWIYWVAASMLSMSAAFAGAEGAIAPLGTDGWVGSNSIITLPIWLISIFVLFAFLVGIAQGLVIRYVLPGITVRRWLAFTFLGQLAALPFAGGAGVGFERLTPRADLYEYSSASATLDQFPAILGAFGIVIALVQSTVLLRRTANVRLWLATNVVGWITGICAGIAVNSLLRGGYAPYLYLSPVDAAFRTLIAWALCFLVTASITGRAVAKFSPVTELQRVI